MADINPYESPQIRADYGDISTIPANSADTWLDSLRAVVMVAVLSFIIGVGSRLIRPWFGGMVHFDALFDIAALAMICLYCASRFWRLPVLSGFIYLQTSLLCVWGAFALGWSLVHGRLWWNLELAALCGWIISAALGIVVTVIRIALLALNRQPHIQTD